MTLMESLKSAVVGDPAIKKYQVPFFDKKGYVELTINTKPTSEKPILVSVKVFDRWSVLPGQLLFHKQGAFYYTTMKWGGGELQPVAIGNREGLNVLEFEASLPEVPMTVGWVKTGRGKCYLDKTTGELIGAFLRFHTVKPVEGDALRTTKYRQMVIALFNMKINEADAKSYTDFKSVSFSSEGWAPGTYIMKFWNLLFGAEEPAVPPMESVVLEPIPSVPEPVLAIGGMGGGGGGGGGGTLLNDVDFDLPSYPTTPGPTGPTAAELDAIAKAEKEKADKLAADLAAQADALRLKNEADAAEAKRIADALAADLLAQEAAAKETAENEKKMNELEKELRSLGKRIAKENKTITEQQVILDKAMARLEVLNQTPESTAPPADTRGPAILSITFPTVTPKVAAVEVKTDEDARIIYAWGVDLANPMTMSQNNLNTLHQYKMEDLLPGRKYQLRVTATDAAGNVTTKETAFDTMALNAEKNTAPVMQSLMVNMRTDNQGNATARIMMRFDEPSTGIVVIGTTPSNEKASRRFDLAKENMVEIRGLKADTNYFLRVNFADLEGSQANVMKEFRTPDIEVIGPGQFAEKEMNTGELISKWPWARQQKTIMAKPKAERVSGYDYNVGGGI